MRPQVAQIVETELRGFVSDLNLSDSQKSQLKPILEDAREKMDEIRDKHPDITRDDLIAEFREIRSSLRERVLKFFTPEQLAKWDAEVVNAKVFLGYTLKP